MINFRELDHAAYLNFKKEYLSKLTSPLDGMWESFIDYSSHKLIEYNQQQAGFYCVNSEACLLLFYLRDEFFKHSGEIFSLVISGDEVKTASAGTNDPAFLSLCLEQQKSISVNTLLFEDNQRIEPVNNKFENYTFRLTDISELEEIFKFTKDNIEVTSDEWLHGYLEEQINLQYSYVLINGETIIATGENRLSKSQPPYSDLGVIVSKEHRGRGIATRVLIMVKEICYKAGLKPICSTTLENIGSIKAIEKSGFISRHRIIDVTF